MYHAWFFPSHGPNKKVEKRDKTQFSMRYSACNVKFLYTPGSSISDSPSVGLLSPPLSSAGLKLRPLDLYPLKQHGCQTSTSRGDTGRQRRWIACLLDTLPTNTTLAHISIAGSSLSLSLGTCASQAQRARRKEEEEEVRNPRPKIPQLFEELAAWTLHFNTHQDPEHTGR